MCVLWSLSHWCESESCIISKWNFTYQDLMFIWKKKNSFFCLYCMWLAHHCNYPLLCSCRAREPFAYCHSLCCMRVQNLSECVMDHTHWCSVFDPFLWLQVALHLFLQLVNTDGPVMVPANCDAFLSLSEHVTQHHTLTCLYIYAVCVCDSSCATQWCGSHDCVLWTDC